MVGEAVPVVRCRQHGERAEIDPARARRAPGRDDRVALAATRGRATPRTAARPRPMRREDGRQHREGVDERPPAEPPRHGQATEAAASAAQPMTYAARPRRRPVDPERGRPEHTAAGEAAEGCCEEARTSHVVELPSASARTDDRMGGRRTITIVASTTLDRYDNGNLCRDQRAARNRPNARPELHRAEPRSRISRQPPLLQLNAAATGPSTPVSRLREAMGSASGDDHGGAEPRPTSAATSVPKRPARNPWWWSPRTTTSALASRAASTIARPGSPAAHEVGL